MRLLYDQNLSHRLVLVLADLFPGSLHVRMIGMRDADDDRVHAFVLAHGFTIVSKDIDFHHRAVRFAHPPKVIWLRTGNCPTAEIEALLRSRVADIMAFGTNPNAAELALP